MSQENTHENCKYYSHKECPIDIDNMKQTTKSFQSNYGTGQVKLSFATDEELNKICKDCNIFTQR